MTRPTVDQIAAVLRNGEMNKRTHLHIAAEISALWAGAEGGAFDVNDLASAITYWKGDMGSEDDLRLARAIDARIIALADARLDATRGAGKSKGDSDAQPSLYTDWTERFTKAITLQLTELSPGWCKGDVGLDALNAILSLHARAEAAEQREVTEVEALVALRKAGWTRLIDSGYSAHTVLIDKRFTTGAARA